MLIINGTAQFMLENGDRTKGDIHSFNMFSTNENFEEQLMDIEGFFLSRGWDNIEIDAQGIIENDSEIKHSVLMQAYKKAKQEGICGVVDNAPVSRVLN